MKAKVVSEKSRLDVLKWLVAVALVVAGIAANYYYAEQALTIRLAGWLVLACVVALVAATTTLGRRFLGFAKEARVELRKVVWPTRQETLQTTMVVVVIVLIMGLLLWGVDSFLLWAVSWVTNLS